MQYATASGRRKVTRILLTLFLIGMVMMPLAAQAESDPIQRLRTLAAQGRQKDFLALRDELSSSGSVEMLVVLGKLYERLPDERGFHHPHYAQAAEYYRKALEVAAQEKKENYWVNRARSYYAALLLKGYGGKKHPQQALELLKLASERGDASAAYLYAKALLQGYGKGLADGVEAERWLRTAIRLGEGRAAFLLADALENGEIKSENPIQQHAMELRALGVSLLGVAAQRGESSAALLLGTLYEEGKFVPENKQEARRWYETGAKEGNIKSMLAAAKLCQTPAADNACAAEYLRQAAREGSLKAALLLGAPLVDSESQLTIEREEAQEWLEKAAGSGSIRALRYLAEYYKESGQVERVEALLKESVRQGNVAAMLSLYRFYRDGDGAAPNAAKARTYLTMAQSSPDISSRQLYTLATYYRTEGLATEAQTALRRAAENNYIPAQLALAQAEEEAQDEAEALHWYERAIAGGSVNAALRAAQYYRTGQGGVVDLQKAKTYMEMAVSHIEAGDYTAMTEIGLAYLHGKGLEKSDDEALRWIRRAADGGNPRALLQLSRMIRWGAVPDIAPAESIRLLEKAAAQDYANAALELAELYAMGTLVPVQPSRAIVYFRQAARLGNPDAMRQLGLAYVSGYGVEKDTERGIRLLKRAAALNDATAMFNLAMLYRYPPEGTLRDDTLFMEWLKNAAKAKQADAQYMLGMAYRKGEGVGRDEKEAARLIEASAQQEYFPAEREWAKMTGQERR